jgi:hypothetical protein
VDLPLGSIGVVFSGGADSAMVLYQLLAQTDQPITLFTVAVKDRDYSHACCVFDLVTWYNQQFPNRIQSIEFDVWSDSAQGIRNLFRRPSVAFARRKVGSMFTGITAHPPKQQHEQFVNYARAFEWQERDPLTVRPIERSPRWFTPYTNLNKQDLAELYHDNHLMDSLFPLTRSCSSGEGFTHCGHCWFCEERLWAFGRLI